MCLGDRFGSVLYIKYNVESVYIINGYIAMNIAGNYPITQQYFCILGDFGVLVKFGASDDFE